MSDIATNSEQMQGTKLHLKVTQHKFDQLQFISTLILVNILMTGSQNVYITIKSELSYIYLTFLDLRKTR